MKYFLALLLFLISQLSFSQPVNQPNSAQIKLRLKKLNFLGSVLYVAAHPDDENTRVITYMANDKLAETAYLSLTRGDGGQNLIGPEIRDLLGVIRTQELLAARRIDGGKQFFTRANDFGFSKSADETISIWGKNEILSDVVKIFRQYQPDVIITRFPADERAGHGHHTSSANFAQEAFDVAADGQYLPDQVKETGVWQAKRLYTNTGRWWNKEINENTPGVITLDVGGYQALLGKSYPEISALSSSQHKSQGWGRAGDRGVMLEFLEYVKGEKAQKDIFEGVNTSWSRLRGGEKVQALIDQAIRDFNEEQPSASVPALVQIRKAILSLDNSVWKNRKLEEATQLIVDCLGLFAEATAASEFGSPGEQVQVNLEVINRSTFPVVVKNISAEQMTWDSTMSYACIPNKKLQLKHTGNLNSDVKYSEPYWLRESHGIGRFDVADNNLIGMPENKPPVVFTFDMEVAGETIQVKRPLIFKSVDPVKGELWRTFEVVPSIIVTLADKVLLSGSTDPRSIKVLVTSSIARKISGELKLSVPEGWTYEPASFPVELEKKGQEIVRVFKLTPPDNESAGPVKATVMAEGKTFGESLRLIQYDHIPLQTILPEATLKAVRTDIKKEGQLIGYVQGAGDEIPSALRNIGYDVVELKNEEVTIDNLKQFQAVVLGIRALNTNERVPYFMSDLLSYAEQGGTLVVQYNTNQELEVETFSPFPITLSRDRVTQEDCEVTILKPDHRVMTYPNKISAKDFQGWVQERGLYFPNQWDPKFQTILSMNDKGEKAKEGGLLIAEYGKGYYVYTGLSFFRQLPEAVPGAYKLFANIVSLNAEKKPANGKSRTKTR
jgi:LmbE family N-acetylglucosaminyl deacetylase